MTDIKMYGSEESAPRVRLRLTARQHGILANHLFPGDDRESVAIVLCGRAGTPEDEVLLAHEIIPIPTDDCNERTPVRVQWRTDRLPPVLERVAKYNWAVLKIHSHPNGFDRFSRWDDESDQRLFSSIAGWTAPITRPHVSAIMLDDGRIVARVVSGAGEFSPVERVSVIGPEIRTWLAPSQQVVVPRSSRMAFDDRTAQAFGVGTTNLLSSLTVGVIGCSGTGSWVIEMLMRLGVGTLVLVDPDVIEFVNLNRIVHATQEDASERRAKVAVMARAVYAAGLGTVVDAHQADVCDPAIVRRLSRCDALVGCVDAIDARDVLCRLATYYVMPYVDVGVRLVADGHGGIAHIAGSAHYVYPESPSLIERGVYSAKQLADVGLQRSDPSAYAEQVAARYISGAQEARPAVASVNAFYAALAVNELLQRLHPYRDATAPFGVTISLSQLRVIDQDLDAPPSGLAKYIGRGDTTPLLGLPALSTS